MDRAARARGTPSSRSATRPRTRRSRPVLGLSLEIAAGAGALPHEEWASGRSALARLVSLIALGDFVSAYVAIRRGVDPTPVDVITRLKAALAT